jgi:hypothetical protein
MKPSKQLARASFVAFIVLCVCAWATWEAQAKLNELRAFEVPNEVVETTDTDGALLFYLKRDPAITRNEFDMARLPDEIFIYQLLMVGMGLLTVILPFIVMGTLARKR